MHLHTKVKNSLHQMGGSSPSKKNQIQRFSLEQLGTWFNGRPVTAGTSSIFDTFMPLDAESHRLHRCFSLSMILGP
jgi:hypothetical protein